MPPKDNGWPWFQRNVLPSLFVALCVTVSGALFAMWVQVQKSEDRFVQIEREQMAQRALVTSLRAEMVSRKDLSDAIDSIGLKVENVLLRAGVKPGRIGKE